VRPYLARIDAGIRAHIAAEIEQAKKTPATTAKSEQFLIADFSWVSREEQTTPLAQRRPRKST